MSVFMASFYLGIQARFEKSDKTSLNVQVKVLNQKHFLYLFYNVRKKKEKKSGANISSLVCVHGQFLF